MVYPELLPSFWESGILVRARQGVCPHDQHPIKSLDIGCVTGFSERLFTRHNSLLKELSTSQMTPQERTGDNIHARGFLWIPLCPFPSPCVLGVLLANHQTWGWSWESWRCRILSKNIINFKKGRKWHLLYVKRNKQAIPTCLGTHRLSREG